MDLCIPPPPNPHHPGDGVGGGGRSRYRHAAVFKDVKVTAFMNFHLGRFAFFFLVSPPLAPLDWNVLELHSRHVAFFLQEH